MDTFQDLLMGIDLRDSCPEIHVGIAKVRMCQLNRVIKNISFNKKETNAIFSEDYVTFMFKGEKATCTMDFKITSEPSWIRDEGNGEIFINDFDIKVKFRPFN